MINGVSLNNYIIDSPAGYDVAVNEVFQEKEALHIILKQKENCMREEDDENKKYDMFKREPIYSGAENTCLW